jgi:hypothetical protein
LPAVLMNFISAAANSACISFSYSVRVAVVSQHGSCQSLVNCNIAVFLHEIGFEHLAYNY